MASVTKNDIPNESRMMSMLWEMIKDYYLPEASEEYYQKFCQSAREIDKQCNSRLGQKLIIAFGEYLEEKH